MSRQRYPRFDQAYAFLADTLDRGEFAGLSRLPSMEELGKMAGVSRSTICKAIDVLKREGRLAGDARRRTRLPGAEQSHDQPDTAGARGIRRTKFRALQQRIERDILNGRYRHDTPLPSEKELTGAYGVSRITLRKALRSLVDQSVLQRRGPRYLPFSISAPITRTRSRIVLLGHGGTIGQSLTWGYWHQESLKLLELECAKAGIALDIVLFQRDDNGPRLFDWRAYKPCDITDREDVIGYLYHLPGHESIDDGLLNSIARGGLPVAILDELGAWPSAGFLRNHRNVRVFRNTLSDAPARQVARSVLDLGHRTAVFVSPHHEWEYSVRRLAGLQQAFAVAEGARIIPVTWHPDPDLDAAREVAKVNLAAFTGFYEKWRKGLSYAYTAILDGHIALLQSKVQDGWVRESMTGLMERAVKIREATVWIVVNDFCAAYAVEFLNNRRLFFPRDFSLISFDDVPESLTKGISSYNFNYAATMVAALRFIANPRHFPASRPVVEIEGSVIPRQSMGRLRRT